ncbi:MAG: DUF2914 domain-containing protein [Parcubacteria group bacterium]|nr:DUF2914 domain-containing protein [Parcubacteria group bacterium]
MITTFTSQYQKAKAWYARYERLLMPATLVAGFVADYATFATIRIGTALIVLLLHFVVAGTAIAFMHAYDAGRISQRVRLARLAAPFALQFTFGALLSASFIFYWFSGSLSVSWPVMLVLVVLMVGNDVFRRHFLKPTVQVCVYFFISLSFFLVALTFLVNSLEAWVFLAASGAAFACMYAYLALVSLFAPGIRKHRTRLARVMATMVLAMSALYFANLIPPIPLAIREAGAYHGVERLGGRYLLRAEAEAWWRRILPGQTVRLAPGERAFVYTAIFAPADLRTTIVHRWEQYDAVAKEWVARDRLPFRITGGRRDGYRGYSVKTNLASGAWRVSVETTRGQVLGRVRFRVEKVDEVPVLEELVR